MPNAWFRLYSEFDDDPKVQMMPEAMQRRLVMLFCLRSRGQLLETFQDSQLAFKWRIPLQELAETKRLFLSQGFIDEQWNVLNWNKRQYVSDCSSDRVRRHREKLKSETDPPFHERFTPTVTETFHAVSDSVHVGGNGTFVKRDETVPDQNRSEQIRDRSETEQKKAGASPSIDAENHTSPTDFVDAWNSRRGPLPKVEVLSGGRRKKLQSRMRAGLTLDRFIEAVENCRVKPFLHGDNDRGWMADFDWLITNAENVEKAINNPYGSNRKPKGANGNGNRSQQVVDSIQQSFEDFDARVGHQATHGETMPDVQPPIDGGIARLVPVGPSEAPDAGANNGSSR